MIVHFISDCVKRSEMSSLPKKTIQRKPSQRKTTQKKRGRKNDDSSYEDPLEGLDVDGDFVHIDENLIKRLKPVEKQPAQHNQPNPFADFPDFSEVLKYGTPVTMDQLTRYSRDFHDYPSNERAADLLGNLPLELLALKYSKMREDNWEYNIKVSNPPKISNQEGAGLCWLHAATNVARYDIMKKFQLDPKFEISQSYPYFCDKVERINLFFENMWQAKGRGLRDYKIHMMIESETNGVLLSDGGMYSFYSNLARKYGMVPKNVYGGSLNCRMTESMNKAIMKILVRMILPLFRDEFTRDQFDQYKDDCMNTLYGVLVKFLGEPPKPTDTFDWTYKDVHGESHTIKNLTPEKFYRTIVPQDDTKILIIHDPRHPETQFISSWVEYGLNMHGQQPTSMINLPLDTFKRVITESLKNDEAVWFACDVQNCFDSETKTWDTERYDYERILGTPLEFDKGDMLETLASRPVHAMVIAGVDTIDNNEGKTLGYKKWRILNSWGCSDVEEEKDAGFYRMTDAYFDRYVTMAVVDLRYFEPDEAKLILTNAQAGKSFTYKFTDAFGAVAFNKCSHCKSSHKK